MSDLKIEVWNSFAEAFFVLEWNSNMYHTSESISKLLNLEMSEYNNLLIEKVIIHDNYFRGTISDDISFDAKNISEKVYQKRFEKTFEPYIMLLKLGGV